jgi:DNA-binding response OmpR family regulator
MALPARMPDVIAVVNSNDDLVGVLRSALVKEGFLVATAHIADFKAGNQDFGVFLRIHTPTVVIYDIAIPYDENWTFLQTLRRLPDAERCTFVVTTVNKRALDQRVGSTEAIEIQGGRADDLDPVIEEVRKIVRSR